MVMENEAPGANGNCDSNSNEVQPQQESFLQHNQKKSTKILGLHFAPLDIPFERRLQTLAVLSWISTFFLMGPFFLFTLIYIFFFTQFGYIATTLYYIWYIIDRDTSVKGGRGSKWVRSWRVWKHYCNYFPIRLVKTAELEPEKNYLFCSHPHGVLCSGAFGNFATEGNNVSHLFPGLQFHMLTLDCHYGPFVPIYREYLMLSGSCSASKESINYILNSPGGGRVAVLAVGGATESLYSKPGTYILHLKKRKGFLKLALCSGASLVPTISFGETDIYDQMDNPEGSRLKRFQDIVERWFGLAPVVVKGRGIFQYSFGMLPNRKPITTVVGSPIPVEKVSNPSLEDIDDLQKTYIDALTELFYSNRQLYSNPSAELTIL